MRFGPAGIPIACMHGNLEGVRYTAKLGLEAMEIEFVRGVRMSSREANEIRKTAKELDVLLSCHCPYWINCAPRDRRKLETAKRNILQTARIAHSLSASPIVFHPGFYMGRSSKEAGELIKRVLEEILEIMKTEGLRVSLGLETTGKISQYGTIDEIIELASGMENTEPVIDFAHIHARSGGSLKTMDEYKKIFDKIERNIGGSFLKNFHSHFSEVKFNEKGEVKHLELGGNSPPFKPLSDVIAENSYKGVIISESPLLEQDALKMKEIYQRSLKEYV